MKIHYVLKGIHENPWTRIMKKRLRQQKGGNRFAAGFSIKVDDVFTEPKRKAPDVVHLAQR